MREVETEEEAREGKERFCLTGTGMASTGDPSLVGLSVMGHADGFCRDPSTAGQFSRHSSSQESAAPRLPAVSRLLVRLR